jgi:hypothetical protein
VGLAKWVQKIPCLILAGTKFSNPILLCAVALEHFPTFHTYISVAFYLFIYLFISFFLSFFFVQNVDLLKKFGIFFSQIQ